MLIRVALDAIRHFANPFGRKGVLRGYGPTQCVMTYPSAEVDTNESEYEWTAKGKYNPFGRGVEPGTLGLVTKMRNGLTPKGF